MLFLSLQETVRTLISGQGETGAEVVHPRSSTESLPLGFPGHSLLPEMAAVTGLLKVIMQSDAFITIVGRRHQQEADLSAQVAAIGGCLKPRCSLSLWSSARW